MSAMQGGHIDISLRGVTLAENQAQWRGGGVFATGGLDRRTEARGEILIAIEDSEIVGNSTVFHDGAALSVDEGRDEYDIRIETSRSRIVGNNVGGATGVLSALMRRGRWRLMRSISGLGPTKTSLVT